MMESNWFGGKMLWTVEHVAQCAPYFHRAIFPPLSIFNSCVNLVQSGVFWYLTQKHHLGQFRLSHPDTLPYRPGFKNQLMCTGVTAKSIRFPFLRIVLFFFQSVPSLRRN